MLKKDTIINNGTKQESTTSNSQVNDRNKTEGEQQKTDEVASVCKKNPEGISHQDIVQVAVYWNIMAKDRDMERIHSLTNKNMESIYNLVKSYEKEIVLEAIQNTGNMLLPNTLTFSSFVNNSEDLNSRFIKILKRTTPDTRFTEQEEMSRRDKKYKFYTTHSPVAHDNVPEFNSKSEAKSWFKSNLSNM